MFPSYLTPGVGQGLVGAVAKPIGGLSDMITHAIDGIHHHTQLDDQVDYCSIKIPSSANSLLRQNQVSKFQQVYMHSNDRSRVLNY